MFVNLHDDDSWATQTLFTADRRQENLDNSILKYGIFFDSNKLETKTEKHKMFHELAKESKIIFWKRFEQFLDIAKINHLQKIKKFLESSWKNLSGFFE